MIDLLLVNSFSVNVGDYGRPIFVVDKSSKYFSLLRLYSITSVQGYVEVFCSTAVTIQ